MGILRHSTALAGALIISSLASAEAADFSFPPQPVVSVPTAVPVPEYNNGWYVRGDIAYGLQEDPDLRQGGANFNNEKLDDTWGFGAGFGYIFDEHFRADVTVDYRINADVQGVNTATGDLYETKVQNTVVLANFYYDVKSRDGFTPYIGAGLGFSHNETDTLRVFAGPTQIGIVDGEGETALAAAAMAGFSYHLDGGWLFDAGYRYLYMGDAKTGSTGAGVTNQLGIDDITAHEFRFGLRYEFR
ncbi:MAG: outer membrane beta-barrel protein [Hyphomicrobiaceae bacterium]|nr:outer membrane beta-barrel protein [Hyphomicrobiaceae bacterium]